MISRVLMVAAVVSTAVFTIWAWTAAERTLEIDACLDRGGCWNRSGEVCEFESNDLCRGD